MDASRLRILTYHLHNTFPLLGVWLRRRAARALLRANDFHATKVLVEAVLHHPSGNLKTLILEGLARLTSPAPRHAVCEAYALFRCEDLLGPMRQWGQAPAFAGAVRLLCDLKIGYLDSAYGCTADQFAALLPLAEDADPEIARRARQALSQLRDPETRDLACRLALETDRSYLLDAVLQGGYEPADTGRRAVLAFLAGHWREWEEVDFQHHLLRTIYQGAPGSLRRRIAAQIRNAGRLDWTDVVIADHHRSAGKGSEGWQTKLDVLLRYGTPEQLWEFGRSAPPLWGVHALRALAQVGHKPTNVPDTYPRWLDLAQDWQDPVDQDEEFLEERLTFPEDRGPVSSLAVSSDGEWLAAGGVKGKLCVWHLPGEPVTLTGGSDKLARCLLFSPDHQHLVSGHKGGELCLWDLRSRQLLHRRKEEFISTLTTLACTPEGNQVFAGSTNCHFLYWDLVANHIRTFDEQDCITALLPTADGQKVICGGKAGKVWMRHLGRPNRAHVIGQFRGQVRELMLSEDGDTLAILIRGLPIQLWSLSKNRLVNPPQSQTDWLTWADFVPSRSPRHSTHAPFLAILDPASAGQTRAVRCKGTRVMVWSTIRGEQVQLLTSQGQASCLTAHTGTLTIFCGTTERFIHLWRYRSRLTWLCQQPVEAVSRADWEWVQQRLQQKDRTGRMQSTLQLLHEMQAWRRKFDVGVREGPRPLQHRAMDIGLA